MKKSEVYKLKQKKKDTNHKNRSRPQVDLVALTNPDMTWLVMIDKRMPQKLRGEILITVLAYTLGISREEAIEILAKEAEKTADAVKEAKLIIS